MKNLDIKKQSEDILKNPYKGQMTFVEVLKLFRAEHNLTITDLAKVLEIPVSKIALYEQGKRLPSEEDLEKIKLVLKYEVKNEI